MKKVYQAPLAEVEIYELNSSVASQCNEVINYAVECAWNTTKAADRPHNINFDEENNCDCYTTGGEQGFWTS